MFTESQLQQIKGREIELKTIEKQIESFKNGFPYMNIYAPATVENKGIVRLDKNEIEQLNKIFNKSLLQKKVIKFVPASGAASRMFKSLFSFREKYDGSEKAINDFNADKSFNSVYKFIAEIQRFAFYEDLKKVMSRNNLDIKKCIDINDFNSIIDYLLSDKGLDYSSLPKGLLKFHKVCHCGRTAFEEHIVEAANYTKDADNTAMLHFTISPEHIEKFETLLKQELYRYEKIFNLKYNISYSTQKPSTDTIAVDMNNDPFCEPDGSLLFRPGGHGALLENLNALNGDIIFIKNIDNIVVDRLKHETYIYKKALAGYLIELQEKIHLYLNILDTGNADEEMISEITTFSSDKLNIQTDNFSEYNNEQKTAFLFSKLNRPIRVCGMVKNEGEPGGGPFWVKKIKGVSLQIVESSQINLSDPIQKSIFNQSTHFNPVDLICGVKDYKGQKFDLLKYVDPDTGFISVKSKDGKDIKALELPGLWNGAMSDWITIFIEVPIITFNPVKTVNDLLRKEHQ
jgi:hypothetical protein